MGTSTKKDYILMQICDPLFPIGAYTLSNGLETYVQKGIVKDYKTTKLYLKSYLTDYLPYNDLLAIKLTYLCSEDGNIKALRRLDELVHAATAPMEVREGSRKLCRSFIRTVENFNLKGLVKDYSLNIKKKEMYGHYHIIFGLYVYEEGLDIKDALKGYLYNYASCVVNNCAKLIPLSQKEGQRILFESFDWFDDSIKVSLELEEKDYARCMPGFEIRAMQHERLYTRLYMS